MQKEKQIKNYYPAENQKWIARKKGFKERT